MPLSMKDAPRPGAELEAEIARLAAMVASASSLIMRVTLDGRILYINRVAPGYRAEDVVGTHIDGYLQPDVVHVHKSAREQVARTRETQTFSMVGPVSTDKLGHYVTQISPILEDGAVTSLVVVATDVTELVETMDRLRDSQTRLQVALDASRMGTWHFDAETSSAEWDDTTRQIFGVEPSVPAPERERLFAERIHPDDRERVGAEIQRGLGTGSYGPIEHRILLPDRSVRWVSASGKRLETKHGTNRVIGSVVDITERRALEARLVEAEKMESIGRLAGGIAHDFNNMLAAMLINLDVATRTTKDPELEPLLSEIKVAAERSAALTAQLLAFARRQVIEPQIVAPSEVVGRIEVLLRRVIGEHIAVSFSCAARGRVRIDPSQLEQIFLNLATNARDAMPAGGSLRVATDDVEIDAEHAHTASISAGRYVRIRVTDSGHGIAPDVLSHVFEPFFTTRPGGTGLGLATCYGIAKQNGGQITVESRPQEETTFSVYLPAQLDLGSSLSEGKPNESVGARGERILVVEDEDLVRRAIERTLSSHGYRVRCTGDPREALAVFEAEGPFDLLVTDVVMPHLGGAALANELTGRQKDLGVLLISGYSEATDHLGGSSLSRRFLQKPFRPQELLAAVRGLIDR
ncbi:MAG: response regulator [Polyangiaceae bacterium]|jgi:two-component system cell cycle sensor histidine kinase/response regulator CckA|nr:response regulator [Polyangiaceae bacterium]